MSSVATHADHDGHPMRSRGVDNSTKPATAMEATKAAGPALVVAAVIVLHVLALAMLTREVPRRNEAVEVRVINAVLVSQRTMIERAAGPAAVRQPSQDATRPAALPHALHFPMREPNAHLTKVTAPPPPRAAMASARRTPDQSEVQTNSEAGRTDAQVNQLDQPSSATPRITPSGAPPTSPPMAPPVATPRRVAHLDCVLVKPDYPQQSLRRGQAGTTVIELETDVAGSVSAARVVTSSGYVHLDDAARAAVLASHCRPYSEDGTPMPARADVPVTFNLDE